MLCWIVIGLYVICQVFLVWAVYTAPLMPDDYDIKEKDVWPINEKPVNKKPKHKERVNEN